MSNEQQANESQGASQPFVMSDEQRQSLDRGFSNLRTMYMQIGGQFCDIVEFAMTNVLPARQQLAALQEEICQDLGVPRSRNTQWNLATGEVTPAPPQPENKSQPLENKPALPESKLAAVPSPHK